VSSVLAEALEATLLVTASLEALGVPYFVGGSLASSLQGEPRATQDVDVVAAMNEAHVEPFAASIERAFFVDRDMAIEAIRRRSEFNVIHLPTMFKVDVFVPGYDIVTRRQLARAMRIQLDEQGRSLQVASAEDVVAQKLRWYRLGGEVSDRQWRDVLGVLRVRGGQLDDAYLGEMCELLDVADLLTRARRETTG
jgi:hypothetical protein